MVFNIGMTRYAGSYLGSSTKLDCQCLKQTGHMGAVPVLAPPTNTIMTPMTPYTGRQDYKYDRKYLNYSQIHLIRIQLIGISGSKQLQSFCKVLLSHLKSIVYFLKFQLTGFQLSEFDCIAHTYLRGSCTKTSRIGTCSSTSQTITSTRVVTRLAWDTMRTNIVYRAGRTSQLADR